MPTQFSHAIRQSIGQRDHQEDFADRYVIGGKASRPSDLLTVVADGMGGHQAGEKASSMAVKEFITHFKTSKNLELRERLSLSVYSANEAISEQITGDPSSYGGMGTTLLAFATDGDYLSWVSVGDSPLLLYRDGDIRQLNADHSMAPIIEEFIAAGALPDDARYTHPHRNLLRSAISGAEIPELDLQDNESFLEPSDILIGCSDGLLTLELNEISELIRGSDATSAGEVADLLLKATQQANHPYQDNTTVAVIRVND